MIRIASDIDYQSIMELLSKMHKESRYKNFPLNKDKLSFFVKGAISNPDSLVLVSCNQSEVDGLFIGAVCGMYFSDCTMAVDYILYVSSDRRKSGIGTLMIEEYFKWAMEKTADDITLSTSTGVSDSAITAIANKHCMVKIGSTFKVNIHV